MTTPPSPQPAPSIGSLDYLMFYAPEVERAVTFYRDVLGAVPIEEAYPHWARLRLANIDIALHLLGEGEPAPNGPVPTFRVHDIGAVRAHLAAAGVPVGEYQDVPGAAMFDFRDVAGNALSVIQWGTSVKALVASGTPSP